MEQNDLDKLVKELDTHADNNTVSVSKDSEYCINPTDIIISRTCPNMYIKSYNMPFLKASGYSEEELVGKRHNILKHPDMPDAIFEDMRKTILAGRPWNGIIKNRRKRNSALGTYYWVDSTITPIHENGIVVGYESIRYPATATQKINAEKLYKDINTGKAKAPSTLDSLKYGNLQRTSLYTNLIILLAISALIMVLGLFGKLTTMEAIIASGLGLFYFNKIRKYRLIDDTDSYEFEALKELSRGNFRYRIPCNSVFTEPLELIRARIANQTASDIDCKVDDAILTTLMNTVRGKVIYTDAEFKVVRFSSSAYNIQDSDSTSIYNLDIHKFLPSSIRPSLARSFERQVTTAKISGIMYDVTISPITVRGDIKGYLFLLYENMDKM